jgi:transcriptional regulator GlxA family with amidase domain
LRFPPNFRRFAPKLSRSGWQTGLKRCIVSRIMTANGNGGLRRKGATSNRRVVVLVVPPVDEFDLVCPIQVFGAANRLAGESVYSVQVATNGKDLKVRGEGRLLSFLAETHYKGLHGSFDSLLLVCGLGTRNVRDPALFAWLRGVAPTVRRLGSVCVGSFLLAEAGLLNGRRATSHWRFSKELALRYPKVKVASEPVWVKDENIYTSAGISAGIDLALAWVEEDCGATIAQEVARELVLFLRRTGGQKQLSVTLSAQASEMKAIQELQVWIMENLRKELSVQVLADRVAMSVRNFERVFTRELGRTPSKYILQARVEAARHRLERTDHSLKQIAAACGFGSPDVMRRSFSRFVGVTPNQYRHRMGLPAITE